VARFNRSENVRNPGDEPRAAVRIALVGAYGDAADDAGCYLHAIQDNEILIMIEDGRVLREGAVALVTGASSGIGAAVATALAQRGMRVVCAARDHQRLTEVVEGLGGQGLGIEADVTDLAAVKSLVDRLPRDWQEIDVLVNAAGHDAGGRKPFHECDEHQMAEIIEANVIGLMWVTRRVIDGMRARGRGHIVNIGSITGLRPYPTGTIYTASKHAVHGFSEALRLDYRETGIRVTEILPGMVRTGFATARLGDAEAAARFYDEFGVCLEAADIARTVIFALEQPAHVVISQLVVMPGGGA